MFILINVVLAIIYIIGFKYVEENITSPLYLDHKMDMLDLIAFTFLWPITLIIYLAGKAYSHIKYYIK